jgi:hypothetical protein
MLGPRTHSVAQDAPRAEQPEAQHNDNGGENEREPKRTSQGGDRTHSQAPLFQRSNLYGSFGWVSADRVFPCLCSFSIESVEPLIIS